MLLFDSVMCLMDRKYKFSVITVCYNAAEIVRETVQSILGQTFSSFEYIVIDGGSSDGTQTIISALIYDCDIDVQLISEKDNGIYDAMNKGIRMAKGDYVIFMNAGDRFYSNSVLEKIDAFASSADVIYGSHCVRYDVLSDVVVRKHGNLDEIWKGMIFSHQSVFVRRRLLTLNLFDQAEPIIADYFSFIRFYYSGCSFAAADVIVSEITAGGVSDRRRIYCTWRRFIAVLKYKPASEVLFFYLCEILKQAAIIWVKKFTPLTLHVWVRRRRNLREGSYV